MVSPGERGEKSTFKAFGPQRLDVALWTSWPCSVDRVRSPGARAPRGAEHREKGHNSLGKKRERERETTKPKQTPTPRLYFLSSRGLSSLSLIFFVHFSLSVSSQPVFLARTHTLSLFFYIFRDCLSFSFVSLSLSLIAQLK